MVGDFGLLKDTADLLGSVYKENRREILLVSKKGARMFTAFLERK